MSRVVILTENTANGDETGAGLMRNRCAFTSRDMGYDWPEAFTYAVVLGWDDDDDPDESSMGAMAERFGWDAPLVEFLRDAHRQFTTLADKTEEPR